jgi:hypothetical protein
MADGARTFLIGLTCRTYALMTAAYPRPFRERFGREMRLAFRSQAVAVADRSGGWALLGLLLQVAWDWIFTLCKEYCEMPRYLIVAILIPMLFVINWLAFHDLSEPHTVRDYLTLAASLLVFAYLGLDMFLRDRNSTLPEA